MAADSGSSLARAVALAVTGEVLELAGEVSLAEELAGLGFDEPFMRIWHMYFAYCEAAFDEGRTDVVQFLLQKA